MTPVHQCWQDYYNDPCYYAAPLPCSICDIDKHIQEKLDKIIELKEV